jgi:DUF4097 and DUF4098 domain-containing protein YvlB
MTIRRRNMRRFRMAKTAILAASFLLLFAFSLSASLAKEKYEEKFEKVMPLAKEGKVDISNVSGNIEVRTWGQDQVKIQALKVSQASSMAKAKENAEKVKIEITEEGNVLRIETKYPKNGKFWGGESVNASVDYWLWIPEKASLEANDVSGNIDVEGPGGPVDLSAISGDVHLRKASKGADCKTISGGLEVTGVTGDVFLKSVSGDISAAQIKGSIQAETVSGNLNMTEVSEANVVRVKALSGEVIYRGKINREGSYSLKSFSGGIQMILPPDSAFDFEAETNSGDITTDFEIKVTGKVSPKEMSGVVNGGGATVKVSSFSGDIKLKKG